MILFQPVDISYVNRAGETILEAMRAAGITLAAPCGGKGICGKCRVKMLIGEGNPLTEEERKVFTEEEIAEGWRLACKCIPKHFKACEIEIPKAQEEFQVVLSESREPAGTVSCDCAKGEKKSIDGCKQAEDSQTEGDACAIAIDIGTTNLEVLLWNLERDCEVGRVVASNPQQAYGADVISRVSYVLRAEDEFETLCDCLQKRLQDMVKVLLKEAKVQADRVLYGAVVGNAVMMHFFAGVSVEGYGKAPYAARFVEGRIESGKSIGLPMAQLLLCPNIESFVGADTVGVLSAYQVWCQEEASREGKGNRRNRLEAAINIGQGIQALEGVLVVDIGTNGELMLRKNDKWYVASTAAGPAFEGARISCGMRAKEGAVRGMQIDEKTGKQQLVFEVVGNGEVQGICGSGLVAVIDGLVQAGVLQKDGYLLDSREARQKGCSEPFVERLEKKDDENAFRMGKQAWLTQADIRELQLAKAAIATGIQLLLRVCGMKEKELKGIVLAGAFGTYLPVESAVRIGLLPEIATEQIVAVGNVALEGAVYGAKKCFTSSCEEAKSELEKIATGAKHIPLAEAKDFQEVYLEEMNL